MNMTSTIALGYFGVHSSLWNKLPSFTLTNYINDLTHSGLMYTVYVTKLEQHLFR